MSCRGAENWLYSFDEPVEGLELPLAGREEYHYDWPGNPLQRRREFHHFNPRLAAHLEQTLDRIQPDLVHIQNCGPFKTTLFPTIHKRGLPLVMTVHDFTLIDPNPAGHPRRGLKGWLLRRLDQASLRRARTAVFEHATLLWCPTQALRQGIGCPEGSSRVLRLPIQPAEAAPLPEDRLRLFFAGTLYRSKGVDLLLEALAGSTGALGQATLEIAGEGDQRVALEQQVRACGLEDRVRFLGFCRGQDLEDAYARANLQVLPSRVPENSPLTVLEAGMRGRPAVASRAGGVPELLDQERGWTFTSEDVGSLRRALLEAGDPVGRARRAEAMRRWVQEEFSPARHWDTVEATYNELRG
jgi:glycosyltransferase involved in cell wall biosynthesis